MGRKNRFTQLEIDKVKEEVLGMKDKAKEETAIGFQEISNDEENWEENGRQDKVITLDEKYKEEDAEILALKLKEAELERSRELESGKKDTQEQMSKDDFNSEFNQKKIEKEEKKESNRLKKETAKNQIIPENTIESWQIEQVLPIMINNSVGKYVCPMSVGLLATLANDNIIYYNENSQRGKKKRAKGYVPYLMVSKVKKIYNQLNSGELNGMLITLNSRIIKNEDGEILNPLIYQSDDMILEGSGQLDAIDGWHRISACRLMLKKWNIKKNQKTMSNPWEYNFIVAIEHKEEIGGGLIFVEYGSTQLKIQSSKLKFLDIYDYANMIVRKLMTNVLRDKVEVDKTRTTGTNNIVTFGTLSDSIKRNFKLTTEDDVELVSEFLSKFFSKLINLFPNYMGNISKEDRDLMRTKDLTLELLMFHGYVTISSRLYENQVDWESKLSKLKSIIQIGQWRGNILQSDCPIWDRIFKGGDEKRIVNGSSSVSFVSKVMGDYIEFGIDYAIKNIKEDDEKKLEKLNK